MGACCGAAHHIYNNLGKPQPATSIDEHSGCQPQPAASMDGKGTCQTLMFYMTLVRHVPKCILSKNICFLSKNICFLSDLLMLGLMFLDVLSKNNDFLSQNMFFVGFIDVGIDFGKHSGPSWTSPGPFGVSWSLFGACLGSESGRLLLA
jgi:hypothetical protein